MNKSLATILATATVALFTLGAQAADMAASAPVLDKAEAKDLKNHADADYKARQKISDAKLIENKAACESAADGSVARACKGSVKAQSKKEKADAKVLHEVQKDDIKANSK